jgi:hypothetical protein
MNTEKLIEDLKSQGLDVEIYYDNKFNNTSLIVNEILFRKNVSFGESMSVESCFLKSTIKNVCKQAELFKQMLKDEVITADELDGLNNYSAYISRAEEFSETPEYTDYILKCYGGKIKSTAGGYREGSGYKPTGRSKHNYYVTPEENIKIKEYIQHLRATAK